VFLLESLLYFLYSAKLRFQTAPIIANSAMPNKMSNPVTTKVHEKTPDAAAASVLVVAALHHVFVCEEDHPQCS
jgi:hypothetical protein